MPADAVIDDLLEGLNPPQRDAVTHGEGPLLILAGAGSGKTRVLTHRIAYLLRTKQARPSEILAITFTNKAAAEMRERVELLVGRMTRAMWVMTFHAACARMLRSHADKLGYTRQFTIYDAADQRRLIKKCLDDLGFDPKRFTPRAMQSQISDAKNRLRSPDEYAELVGSNFEQTVADVYQLYNRELHRMNAMDFDDLLVRSVHLLERFQEVHDHYAQTFRWVMVDEYQDTNRVQYRWLQLLTSEHRNLAVVGDDAQCLVASTPVTMADGTAKPIGDIQLGEAVMSGYGSGVYRPARVTGVFRSERSDGIRISTRAGREILCTPEHTVFAGYRNGLTPPMYMTYLMRRRDMGCRVGMTRTTVNTQGKSVAGFQTRAMTERAEAAWVISTHESEADARTAETLLSLRYGIPTLRFVAKAAHEDQATIDRVFASLDTDRVGVRLLHDQDIWPEDPHHLWQGFEGRRRNVVITLCAASRGDRVLHTVSVGGRDEETRAILEGRGFRVKNPRRDKTGWRSETYTRTFSEALALARKIQAALDVSIRCVARLGSPRSGQINALPFIHASSVRPGMAIFDERGEYDVVETVEKERLTEPVVDLNIEGTHNFIAGGLTVHNSIYGFRGADIRNILEFSEDYPDAHVVKLEQNYRSTQTILDAANAVISHNRGQMPKHLWTDVGEGDKVRVREMADEFAEARWVTAEIQRLVDEGVSRNEIAVFYRTNAQSRVLEDMLVRAGVAYQVIGGPKFYERAEIKDAIQYLNFLVNPQDATAFTRIANSPRRGIGQTSLSRVIGHAAAMEMSVWEAAEGEVPGLATAARKSLTRFMDTMRGLRERAEGGRPVAELLDELLDETGYRDALRAERTIEAQGRLENLDELITAARQFDINTPEDGGTLGEFLQQTSLVADADTIRDDEGLVTLMTMHNAKGLEFPIVFMIGMEEGIFPHSRSIEDNQIEEERRLAYVGLTRAMRDLTLSFARRRQSYGGAAAHSLRSRFLDELPAELTDQAARIARGFPAPGRIASWSAAAAASAEAENDAQIFHVGDDIVHSALGEGVITGVQPGGIVVVRFAGESRDRSLMADVAPIRKR